jgi:hypothetical protein
MPQRKFYLGLFLITACTLMLQVLQTRILSVVAWYHLAFFAISMAMFGLTAGAVFVYLRRDRFTERTLSFDLAYYSVVLALTTAVCLAIQMTLAPLVALSFTAAWTWFQLALCIAAPFFVAGIVVSLALTRAPFPIGRIYAVDLLGAAVGCLGALVVLNLTDGPTGIFWTAVLAAAAAMLFASASLGDEPAVKPPLHALTTRRREILLALTLVALVNGATDYGLQPLIAKGVVEGGDSYIFREWNTFSRVTVQREKPDRPHLWGPSPLIDQTGYVAIQRVMKMDGDAGTSAVFFDGDFAKVEFLKFDVTNVAYFLPARTRAAILGVGGGRDVLSAATFGYRDITGVELNPLFVRLLTRDPKFASFTNLSTLPGVRFFVDEGRSWFARSEEKFDLLQMSLIDTWAATGAGAFSLSENGIYTVQAWQIFLDRLSDRGVFTVSRWFDADEPAETARLVGLATAALLENGVTEPRKHIVLMTQGSIATILVSSKPFGADDLTVLTEVAQVYRHNVLVSPGQTSSLPVLERILSARSTAELMARDPSSPYDVTPPTDDRPFFFNQLRLDKPWEALQIARNKIGSNEGLGGVRDGNLVATATLLLLLVVALVLVCVTIVVPLRPAVGDVGRPLAIGGSVYFALIGIGFMLVEIGLLQRMSVFLGHPVYSLSVLLFTLILSTGAGSWLSERFQLRSRAIFSAWAVATGGLVIALPALLERVLPQYDGATLVVRASLCVACMAPVGVLLGFAFPTGMRLISLVDRRPTPWFWGINGAAGVLASIFAVACSIAFGIAVTLYLAGVCYLLLVPAALALRWPSPSAAAPASSMLPSTAT